MLSCPLLTKLSTCTLPLTMATEVLFVYGSQTGTAQGIAEDLYEEAKDVHKLPCRLVCFEKKPEFDKEKIVVVVSSTTGDGEPPDNTSRWWRKMRKKPPRYGRHVGVWLSYALQP